MSFEKLDVYQRAKELARCMRVSCDEAPRGSSPWINQAKRAATSILLNIAEGAGKGTPAEKRRFYRIARGSTLECAAALDAYIILFGDEHHPNPVVVSAKELSDRVSAMLYCLGQRPQ